MEAVLVPSQASAAGQGHGATPSSPNPALPSPGPRRTLTVSEVCEAYLNWHRANHRAEYKELRCFLKSFMAALPEVTVEELSPRHIDKWFAARPRWSRETQNQARYYLCKALSWAAKPEVALITTNPIFLPYRDRRPPGGRDLVISQEDCALLRQAAYGEFAEVLEFISETGVGPYTACNVTVPDFDAKEGIVKVRTPNLDLPPEEQMRVRLSPRYAWYFAFRLGSRTEGYVFRTNRGNPWTKPSIDQVLRHLERRLAAQGKYLSEPIFVKRIWAVEPGRRLPDAPPPPQQRPEVPADAPKPPGGKGRFKHLR